MKIECLDDARGTDWNLFHGDCVEVARQLPQNAVDLCLYSPPFANVYTYSDSDRDMGNVDDEADFVDGYRHLARELLRITRPGRVCLVHCKQTIRYSGAHGRAGWHDFRGDLIRVHEEEGWRYASEFVLWTDPVVEQRKTNNQRLLYKQLRTDSTFSGAGMPEYLLVFRKWALTKDEQEDVVPVPQTRDGFPLEQWQRWASPVWMTVNHTDTLNVKVARGLADERHMCPLSLDVIRRGCVLYSNPGEVVFSPFAGVGSEGVGALKLKRRFVGVELKSEYFAQAAKNLADAANEAQASLFGGA
jgi:DNA modification methylase